MTFCACGETSDSCLHLEGFKVCTCLGLCVCVCKHVISAGLCMLSAIKVSSATGTYFNNVSAYQSMETSPPTFDSLILRSSLCFDSHHFLFSQLQAQVSIFIVSKTFPALQVGANIKEDTLLRDSDGKNELCNNMNLTAG